MASSRDARRRGALTFENVYHDPRRAEAYAKLEYPGTYFLAFRDIPELLRKHVHGSRALDFGCGTGRSTRFLQQRGFDARGIDISPSMIELARKADPEGDYALVADGEFGSVEPGSLDLVFSAFAFDNIPGVEKRARLLAGLRGTLRPGGRLVLLDSTPEIYTHEWASFTTKDFPENLRAESGDEVRIVMKDVPDHRPVVDILWRRGDYLSLFETAGLALVEEHRPLGTAADGIAWVSETHVAPWVLFVLAPERASG